MAVDVLFVDLDGTLVATNVLYESLLLAVKSNPLVLLILPVWAVKGWAWLKRALAKRIRPDCRLLPYREAILEFLRGEKAQGRKLVLATASDSLWATEIAQHLDLFDDVLASDGQKNLKGFGKLTAIEAYCRAHGFQEFAYLGNDTVDIPIWQRAAQVYVVEPAAHLLTALQKIRQPARIFGVRDRLGPAIRALRPLQWMKNCLVFVPLLLAHELITAKAIGAVLAFIAFSACASSVYLLNDLLDIEADRHHPTKRYRPFASGSLPVSSGLIMGCSLLVFGVLLALTTLPWTFVEVLALYLVLTTLYSLWLKREIILDILILASLYMLRILAGGMATHISVSEWLIAFSIFFFMSLALVKRYAELARLSDKDYTSPKGREYMVTDLNFIENIGPTSGYMAVLVLVLYINSDDMKRLYTNVWALWLICPLLLYWVSRVWLMARRLKVSEDPLLYALTDRSSLLVCGLVVGLLIIARSW
jgi:4-hydroxybenzoate polyprenyltransferase/phosphoserine phosphatase